MKFTAFLLLVTCLQVYASSTAQTVSLSVKDASLNKVLKEINRQTGYQFFYNDALLKKAGKISLDLKNMPIEKALDICFTNIPVIWTIENDAIIIKAKPALPKVQEQPAELPPPLHITGKVYDEKGSSIPGVNIVIKGTQLGTTTNADGEFSLDVADNKVVLVFSYVGYEKQEITVGTQRNFRIVLKAKISEIDEVQVIAYGTTTKRLSTGSISSVKSADIELRPVTNVTQALQGKVAGISVTNFSPGIGSPQQILVRGTNSITSGTNPLIIVDGVIMNDDPGGLITDYYDVKNSGGGANTYQQGNSPLNNINPNDIESIDILKDADATAIYGSRGTNGVVLITTKKATIGATKTQINISTGFKRAAGITKRMNTEQYLKMRRDAFATGNMTDESVINPITPDEYNAPDLTLWSQTAYTDYPEMELNNPAPNYNFDGTMTGGTKIINFLASCGYYRMYDTYMFNPYQERLNGRLQLNHTSQNEKFRMSFNTLFGRENQKFTTTNFSNVLGQANVNAPNFELYKEDGSLNFASGQGYISGMYYNPMPNKYLEIFSNTNNFSLTSEISYDILKGLTAKVQVNYGMQNNKYRNLYPSTAVNVQNRYDPVPKASFTTNEYNSLNIEPYLTYTTKVSKASINALAGGTYLDKSSFRSAITVTNPGSDDLLYSYSSGNPTTAQSSRLSYKFMSVYGRVNFNWNERYLVNLTYRRDGSSRFGPNNKFADFGSVGLGWIFTEESIIKDNMPFLSYGKLRGSIGITGNDKIGDYIYVSMLQASAVDYGIYQGNVALSPANYANKDVKWEATTKKDLGLELGFINNRLLLNTTVYRSISNDLLVTLPLPSQTGFTGYTGNFPGVVQNTGIEIDITTHNFGPDRKIAWSTKFNITHNSNILKEFPGLEESSYAESMEIGRALPSSDYLLSTLEFPFHFTGIDPQTGLPQFKDINGDGLINWEDQNTNEAWFGSATPTTWGGLTNTITYKGFSLDVFLQFSNGIFTRWNFYMTPNGNIYNPSADVADNYWMQPGDSKEYPRLLTGIPGQTEYTAPIEDQYPYSTACIYKGYYIRLKNVQLSYSLPQVITSKLKFDNMMIYVSGENLAVYTPVKLYKDPEIFWSRSAGILRTITTGLRLSF